MKTKIAVLSWRYALCAVLARHHAATEESAADGYLGRAMPARESGRTELIRLALRERRAPSRTNIAIGLPAVERKRDRFP